MPFLLRLRLQDRPGALGAIATALGSAGVDILALDVVEHTAGGDAVDDIVIDLPDGGMPDSAVSACASVPGVAVSFVAPYPVGAPLGRDLELVELMAERPGQAEAVLTAAVPDVFRLAWGVVLDASSGTAHVERRSIGAPGDDGFSVDWLPLASATRLVTDGKLPDGWRGAVLAAAPLGGRDRALVIGRHANPDILDSEVVRLGYLATLAATLTTTTAAAGESAGPGTAIAFDHVVLTVADVEASVSWYSDVLGMVPVTFGNGRRAAQLGAQKINFHAQSDPAPAPVAARRTPGSGDLCVVVPGPIEQVSHHLESCGVPLEAGPVSRTGAQGPMTSLYVRDPDGNLVELGCYRA